MVDPADRTGSFVAAASVVGLAAMPDLAAPVLVALADHPVVPSVLVDS